MRTISGSNASVVVCLDINVCIAVGKSARRDTRDTRWSVGLEKWKTKVWNHCDASLRFRPFQDSTAYEIISR